MEWNNSCGCAEMRWCLHLDCFPAMGVVEPIRCVVRCSQVLLGMLPSNLGGGSKEGGNEGGFLCTPIVRILHTCTCAENVFSLVLYYYKHL